MEQAQTMRQWKDAHKSSHQKEDCTSNTEQNTKRNYAAGKDALIKLRKGGVGIKDVFKVKRCSREGCTHIVVKGGLCKMHGAKKKLYSSDGCTNH
jgi:hypothetical protein